MPAVSPKALKRISQTIRRWTLHHRSDKALQDLAEIYNPQIRGWINYYGHFYRSQLHPTLQRIDAYAIRWARRKFKRLRRQTKGARGWLARIPRDNHTPFTHSRPCHGEPKGSRKILEALGGELPGRRSHYARVLRLLRPSCPAWMYGGRYAQALSGGRLCS